ncbi:MAG: class I SAM-dependent methyltransferase [Bacteroidota bacterium]
MTDTSVSILETFQQVMTQDRDRYIKPWLVGWAYQDKKQTRYSGNLPQDFYQYNGPEDLEKWFHWQISADRPSYFSPEKVSSLVDQSRAFDQALFDRLGLNFPEQQQYDRIIGSNNAQDYYLTHFYDVPERNQVKKVLDFGAGFGRQANLWSQKEEELLYIGMDAIPKSYCLQNLYYRSIDPNFREYVDQPAGFSVNLDQPGLYHLPTWRTDLIPDNSLDMVLCVQVLPELNGRLVRHMIDVFQRVLKPGGALYLRDHDQKWKPGYKFNLNHYLPQKGFALEFRPHIVDREDLAGVPRIWRKVDPRVQQSQEQTRKERMRQWVFELDALTNGKLRSIYKRLTNKKT